MSGRKDTLIGTTIEHFEIIDLIGRGGMSSVYLALDKELERKVALKIPHARFIDSSGFVKRFRREAKAMARLRHPNIVQIYSVGSHGDMPYFAMEYIRGESLAATVKRGAIDAGTAMNYITQIAHALGYAHKKDVVHRDIKPANILMDPSGRLLVTDFGVSKLLSDDTTQETMGFVGTPQYMSPEQCGQGTLDHRTDVYSLGIVLFEILTGQAPFLADSPAETIKKQLFDAPEFSDEFKKKIPERIQTIAMKMLEKEPELRYPDIAALLKEFEALERECEERTVPVTEGRGGRSNGVGDAKDFISRVEVHRTRWPIFVVAGVLAVCAIAFGTSFMLSDDSGFSLGALTALFSGEEETPGLSPQPEPEPGEPTGSVPKPPADTGEPPQAEPGPDKEPPAATPDVEPPSLTGTPPVIPPGPGPEPEPVWTEVVIESKPSGAEVFFDSESMGKTPLTLTEVPLGKHMLAMKLEDYPDYSGEISADESEPGKIFHDFVAAKEALIPKGSLSIDSEPSGASVYIDGERKGKTPLKISELRAAEHTIKLELDEYEILQKEITLDADENLRMSLNLIEKPKFGDVIITSEPEGAEVVLNGKIKGVTPLTLRRLPVGKYDVVLQREGYEFIQKELVCAKNTATKFNAALSMTPRFAALQAAGAGDNYMELGDFAAAIAAYEKALSLDPQQPVYSQKLDQARRAVMIREMHDLILSYEFAYDSENTMLLASLLNDGDPDFLANQISNADKLFQEFERIDMTLTDVKIDGNNVDEAFVKLHIKISASYAETRVSMDLLEANQTLTLRKNAEAGWRICAIE